MGHSAAGDDFKAKCTFRAQRKLVFGGFAIDDVLTATRRSCGGDRSRAITFFTNYEENAEIAFAGGKQALGGHQHGGNDAFGIASAAAPDLHAIIARRNKRRDSIHMSGKSHYGMAEAHENVVAIRLDGQALDFAVEALGEGAQMVEQVLADFALVGRYRFDVDKGPGELKYLHCFKEHAQDGDGAKRPASMQACPFCLGGAYPRPLRSQKVEAREAGDNVEKLRIAPCRAFDS